MELKKYTNETKRIDENRTILITFKQWAQTNSSYDKKKQKNLHKLYLYSCTDLKIFHIAVQRLERRSSPGTSCTEKCLY